MVPHVLTDTSLTIVAKNKAYHVQKGDELWPVVMEALKNEDVTEDDVADLLDKPKAINKYMKGRVEVRDDGVYHNGELLHSVVANKILDFMTQGLPFKPLVNFVDKLMANPSYKSRQQLYDFLERHGLPITSDGMILGYKAVTSDFLDKHTKTIDNSIGSVVKMDRSQVDDETGNGCSRGLHIGSLGYVSGFKSSDDVVVICEFDPANVVSVPRECDCTKLRCCEYRVVGLYEGELTSPLYSSNAKPYESDEDESGAYNEESDYEDPEYYDEDEDLDDDFYDVDDYEDQDDEEGCGDPDCEACEIQYGKKPNGDKYFNTRDENGRFRKVSDR